MKDYQEKMTQCLTHSIYFLVQFTEVITKAIILTFLEECKYKVKKKTAKRFMTTDLTDSCFYSEPKSKDKSLVDTL